MDNFICADLSSACERITNTAKEKNPVLLQGCSLHFFFGAEEKSMPFLPTFPEIVLSSGTLHIRHDLTNQSITISLIAFEQWDVDTVEKQVNSQLIHFIQPDNSLVGVKIFSDGGIS